MTHGLRFRLMWSLLAMVLSGPAAGQVASVGAAESGRASHGWMTVPGPDQLQLTHLPPRDAGGDPAQGSGAAGVVRPVRPLLESPVAMAGVGDRVFAVFDPTDSPSGMIRRVLVSRAVPAGLEGVWTDLPPGMFDMGPSLPGTGELIGVGVAPGRDGGVIALLRSGADVALLRADGDAWKPVALPDGFAPQPSDRLAIVSFGPGVLIAWQGDAGSRAWAWTPEGGWTPTTLSDWGRFWSAGWRHGYGREVILGAGVEPGTEVWGLASDHAWLIGRLPTPEPGSGQTGDSVVSPVLPLPDGAGPDPAQGVGPSGAVCLLASSGRLVVVRRDAGGVRVGELSLVSGRTVYEGEVRTRGAVSAGEFRLIVLMLLGVMVAALVVIIRPSGDAAWGVPDGWALADPSRRLLATVIDGFLVVWLVAPAFGATVSEVITLQVLVMPEQAWLAVPASLVAGSLAMGVWEGLLGYSPGKFLVGLRVYRATPGGEVKLGVFWGLVRATVKWLIPPVAALALVDPEGRHRGDSAARAVVVCRAAEPDEA